MNREQTVSSPNRPLREVWDVTDTEVVDNLEHACWGQYMYVYIYIYIYTKNQKQICMCRRGKR